jgi:acetylornithine/succinyldiaminopimelate/putrescine aminotransferase
LRARLSQLVEKHRVARSTRGLGLLQALVLDGSVDARDLVAKLRDAGVLLTIAGGTALRFSPPLIIEQAELDEGIDTLDKVLGEVS